MVTINDNIETLKPEKDYSKEKDEEAQYVTTIRVNELIRSVLTFEMIIND